VVSAVLGIVSALILVLIHSVTQFSYIVNEIFPNLWVVTIVLSLILLAGSIITFIPASRTAGLGILMAVGGVLAFEWTGLSLNFYASAFDFGYPRFTSSDVVIALGCLAVSVALCTVSAIGIAHVESAGRTPDRDVAPARIFFILAAIGALATVALLDFYPDHLAFRQFNLFGNVLDVLGVIALAVPFAVLALVVRSRQPAIGTTVAWLGTVTFLAVSALTYGFRSNPFSGFSSDWRYFIYYPAIAFAGVFAVIGITKLPSAASRAATFATGASNFCRNGHAISPNVQFCPFCGASPQLAPAMGSPLCPNGHVVPDGDAFCSECGQPVTSAPSVNLTTPARANVASQPPYAVAQPQWNSYPSNNGFAIAALICGILGASVLGVAFGFIARSQIRQSMGRQKGDGMALAGIILGFIWIVISIAFTVSIYVFLAHQNNYPYN
jgi:hypothetical protein